MLTAAVLLLIELLALALVSGALALVLRPFLDRSRGGRP